MSQLVSPWVASFLLRLAKNENAEKRGKRFQKLAEAARRNIEQIMVAEVPLAIQGLVLLIDVREKSEFRKGHIPNALHLSRGILELEIESRAASFDHEIIVYCGHGNRSALAAESLQRMGYSNVKVIKGGFKAWLDAGFPAWRGDHFFED